jgi:hypothetical protein
MYVQSTVLPLVFCYSLIDTGMSVRYASSHSVAYNAWILSLDVVDTGPSCSGISELSARRPNSHTVLITVISYLIFTFIKTLNFSKTSTPKFVWQHTDSFLHHIPKAWLLICFDLEVATR